MVNNYNDWKKEYRKDKSATWIRLVLSDASEYFFKATTKEEYEDWYKIQEICLKGDLTIVTAKLQYRSNCVEHKISKDSQGFYIIRSMIGVIGGDSIPTITFGEIKDNIVYKTSYSTPDLSIKDQWNDEAENCFPEAMVIWTRKT